VALKITAICVYGLELPLAKPYLMSRGRIFELLHSTVVKIETDSGIAGWGEVCPWGSNYLPAFSGALRAAIAELGPHLIGSDPCRPEVLTRLMDSVLTGHNYAKAAIDFACWDILGKATGRPVCELLGGKFDDNPVPLVSTQMIDTPDNMERNLQYWRERGYRRHSIKLGGGVDSDIERLQRLAKLRGSGEEFIFDANGGWSPWEAIRVLNATADLEYWIEQPCVTYDQCKAVKRSTRQAMSLDECIFEMRDLLRAINDETISVLNIKVARLGGLTRARWIRDVCMSFDIPILAMCMAGTVLNDTVVAHFAQSIPGNRCLGAWSCQEMLTVDLAPGQGARNVDGNFAPPQLPGLGVEPDRTLLGAPLMEFK
jgi:L-alanine-DL-glutamate epimerase-like enolase superfamily enzyme